MNLDRGDGQAYESRQACENDAAVLPSLRQCIKDAAARNEAESRAFMDCIQPLENNYTACINERLTCDDPSALDVCLEDYEIGFNRCDPLPADVERGFEDCFA